MAYGFKLVNGINECHFHSKPLGSQHDKRVITILNENNVLETFPGCLRPWHIYTVEWFRHGRATATSAFDLLVVDATRSAVVIS